LTQTLTLASLREAETYCTHSPCWCLLALGLYQHILGPSEGDRGCVLCAFEAGPCGGKEHAYFNKIQPCWVLGIMSFNPYKTIAGSCWLLTWIPKVTKSRIKLKSLLPFCICVLWTLDSLKTELMDKHLVTRVQSSLLGSSDFLILIRPA
jgi:hypothetical protein